MKRVMLVLALVASTMLVFGIQGGQALTNGIEGTDLADDVLSRFEVLRNRGLYAKDRPYVPQFDVRNWSFQATNIIGIGRRITATIKTEGPWPAPGAPATAMPAGVSVLETRWVYSFKDNEANIQTVKQPVGQLCTDKETAFTNPVDESSFRPIRFDNAYCSTIYDGPFPQIDGWSKFLSVSAEVVGTEVFYTWAFGWYDMNAILYFFEAHTTHDKLSCWDASAGEFQPESDCTPTDGAPPHGELTVDQANNTLTLRLPYTLRADAGDDADGLEDETRSYPFMRAGDTVATVQAGTYGTVQAKIPPEEAKPCYKQIFAPVKDATGQDVQALLPPPFNDPNACLQTGAGLTFAADWAPGNPFQAPGISNPFPSTIGEICVGSACNPDWGSFIPRVFPRARSYYPGLNGPFCRYPTGYVPSVILANPAAPSGVTTKDATTFLKGVTLDPPPDDEGIHVPAVIGNQADLDVPLGTGTDDPCFHIRDNNGLFFVNWGGSFTAG